jgi:hypothetical protein
MSTITTTEASQLPPIYNQFLENVIGRGIAATSEPYQAYDAPRIAGFNADQNRSMELARTGVGIGDPALMQAQQLATQAGTMTFPGSAQAYMNPYLQGVVNNIGTMAARNLQENLLPQVNRTFVGGGTFGGSRSAEFTNRAVRDANEAAMRQQAETLAAGYGQAADIFGNDMTRQLAGATNLSSIGQAQQQMRAGDVAALGAVGQQGQNLAQRSADLRYADFVDERDNPYNQANRLASLGQGIKLPETRTTTAPGPNTTGSILGGVGSVISGIGSIVAPNP